MAEPQDSDARRLKIKKYSNRRYYDTTRSRHVTLGQMHELICDGYELTVTDATTGDDITQQVLTQIMLARDPLKLGIFPTDFLHQVIRTQQQLLGTVIEQFFRQTLEAHKASQERWASFLRNTLGLGSGLPANPMEWTRSFMGAFDGGTRSSDAQPDSADPRDKQIDELQRRIKELTRRVEQTETNSEK